MDKIRPCWKLIAVTRWNHTELAPWWNFFHITRGEISSRVERVTTYRSFLLDRGNFTPGGNLTCDGALSYKIDSQVTPKRFIWFLFSFAINLNSNIQPKLFKSYRCSFMLVTFILLESLKTACIVYYYLLGLQWTLL